MAGDEGCRIKHRWAEWVVLEWCRVVRDVGMSGVNSEGALSGGGYDVWGGGVGGV